MVKILRDVNPELRCLSAETIANIARLRRARRAIRQHGGMNNLVSVRLQTLLSISSGRIRYGGGLSPKNVVKPPP